MSNRITVVRDASNAALGEFHPAKLPVGDFIVNQATGQHQTIDAIGAAIGIWETSPGEFRRHVPEREFCHFLSGWCIFTPEDGEPVELYAGDAALFPANCSGIWDVRETLRKSYVLF